MGAELGAPMTAWRDERGMTLIEVLIAITILAVGILALMNSVTAGYLSVVFSGSESTATEVGRQLFEQLRNQPFNPGPTTASDSPAPNVTRSWTIATVGATPSPNGLARITLTVTWPSGSGATQSTTFETLRAQCAGNC